MMYVDLSMQNPNLVGAVLLNATLDIYRGHQSDIGHDSYVSHLGEPFAKVTVGKAIIEKLLSANYMPFFLAAP